MTPAEYRAAQDYPIQVGPCNASGCPGPSTDEAGFISIASISTGRRIWRCAMHDKIELLELMQMMGHPLVIDVFAANPKVEP